MRESQIEFLHRRANEELSLAESTNDPVAAQIHRAMALLYAEQIAEARQRLALKPDNPVSLSL